MSIHGINLIKTTREHVKTDGTTLLKTMFPSVTGWRGRLARYPLMPPRATPRTICLRAKRKSSTMGSTTTLEAAMSSS